MIYGLPVLSVLHFCAPTKERDTLDACYLACTSLVTIANSCLFTRVLKRACPIIHGDQKLMPYSRCQYFTQNVFSPAEVMFSNYAATSSHNYKTNQGLIFTPTNCACSYILKTKIIIIMHSGLCVYSPARDTLP